jgi:Arc/MetJ family transcription regulator
MSVTINLSAEEVAQIKRATDMDDEKEAVAKAAREFLRVAELRELKAASGKVDYTPVEEQMEALELREGQAEQ